MRLSRVAFITTGIGTLTLFSIFLNSKSVVELAENLITESDKVSSRERDFSNVQSYRYVTPSLAELGLRGSLAKANQDVIMLTRIPDAGAELLVLILQRLQGYNAFKHIRLPPGDDGLLTTLQQELLVEEITGIIRQEAIPLSFDGDVRFLNFTEFGRQTPTFISLIRNPLVSRNFRRYNKARGAIGYFCGQDKQCFERNNKWALDRAKENIAEWYPVVGILDYMEETLGILEKKFPYFFKGAAEIYKKLRPTEKYLSDAALSLNQHVGDTEIQSLADEIELYHWVKSRLFEQASAHQ